MIRVEWQIEPAISALKGLLERLRDLRPAWRQIVVYMRRATLLHFASEGGRGGAQWAPLTPRYAAQKEKVFPGQPIMRASDQLFRSLTDQTADSVVEIEAQALTYGTSLPYGRYHQRGEGYNPQRKILVVTQEDRRQLKKIVRAHLENQAALSGFEVI